MDSPPRIRKRIRKACIPGTPAPSREWTIYNQALYLTYKGHIPKDEYRAWIEEVVMPNYCRYGMVDILEMAHETEDTANRYDHTHVVLCTTVPIRSKNRYILAWKHTPETRIEDREGLEYGCLTVLRGNDEIGAAMYTLGDEDREYSRYHRRYRYYKSVLELKTSGALDQSENPRYKVAHLVRWQAQVAELMNSISILPGLDINLVWVRGGSGVTTLVRAIKYRDPERFHVLQGVPTCNDLRYAISLPEDEWTRDTLIVDTGVLDDHEPLDKIMEEIVRASTHQKCCSLWILTNVIPSLDVGRPDRWRIYSASANWTKVYVSYLTQLTYEQARIARDKRIEEIRRYLVD